MGQLGYECSVTGGFQKNIGQSPVLNNIKSPPWGGGWTEFSKIPSLIL